MKWNFRKKKTDREREVVAFAIGRRDLEILEDSVNLLQSTRNPDTFFYRYRLAVESARSAVNLCHGEMRRVAEETLTVLCEEKAELCNRFLDRCCEAGRLPFVREEILAHREELPPESFAYFLERMDTCRDEDDDGEYIYCSVEFTPGGKTYYYLTENRDIRCGDRVVVPVGARNSEEFARVVAVEVFRGNQAPIPPDRLKHIVEPGGRRGDRAENCDSEFR